jgi:hypothetical protein
MSVAAIVILLTVGRTRPADTPGNLAIQSMRGRSPPDSDIERRHESALGKPGDYLDWSEFLGLKREGQKFSLFTSYTEDGCHTLVQKVVLAQQTVEACGVHQDDEVFVRRDM